LKQHREAVRGSPQGLRSESRPELWMKPRRARRIFLDRRLRAPVLFCARIDSRRALPRAEHRTRGHRARLGDRPRRLPLRLPRRHGLEQGLLVRHLRRRGRRHLALRPHARTRRRRRLALSGEALAVGRAGAAQAEDELLGELRAEGRFEPLPCRRRVRIEAGAVLHEEPKTPPARLWRHGVHPGLIIGRVRSDP
jgi:hypothetical protein